MFTGLQNQEEIYSRWHTLVEANGDIKNDSVKLATAIILENTQSAVDQRYNINNCRGLINEAAGIGTGTAFGPWGTGYGNTATNSNNGMGDARVPSVVIPMIRRIFPNLIAHKLVGVQPMQGPIGMAFAFRAKYGRFGKDGRDTEGKEIGYLTVSPAFTGAKAPSGVNFESVDASTSGYLVQNGNDPQNITGTTAASKAWKSFFGNKPNDISSGADTSDAENWAVGSTMPEAGFEFLKATVTAKTRKLGVQITRETEEDMKAMQGLNAQNEVSEIISYEVQQDIDRQLLGEIVKSAISAGNFSAWDPAKADGRNQRERVDALYTVILNRAADIATQSRRGAANWCVASPAAAALLEAHIYNPLGVAGGLGRGNAFGKNIENGIGVTEIGALRNGTIKLFRDTLAGGNYILLGYKGNTVYDAGVMYLPYIPLELMHAVDPTTMNPITAARTRYGVTTNLFGAGQFYHYIDLTAISGTVNNSTANFIG